MTLILDQLISNYHETLNRLSLKPSKHAILIHLGEKILFHSEDGKQVRSFQVSSSPKPMSCIEDSNGTPWGLHFVGEKFGENEPPKTVFVGRQSTGLRYDEREDFGPNQKTLVTTRILRLKGLEEGLNLGGSCDSFRRFIYIHGTNHPARFPENISAGCILLKDTDLLELFKAIPLNSHVWIDLPEA